MKIKLISLLALFATCSVIATTIELEGKISNYGLIKVPDDQNAVSAPQTPSGVGHILHSPPTIVTTTNRIPAKLGVAFGIAYEVYDAKAEDGDELFADVVMTYPSIAKPDGSTSKGFTWSIRSIYKNHKAWGIVDYSFDHDYELVTGLWRFEIRAGGKTIGSKEFTVFRE